MGSPGPCITGAPKDVPGTEGHSVLARGTQGGLSLEQRSWPVRDICISANTAKALLTVFYPVLLSINYKSLV